MRTVPQVLCSTGTFVRWDTPQPAYRAILDYGPSLNIDGLEIMFYRSWYGHMDRIVAELAASGLEFPVVHAEKRISSTFASGDADGQAQALQRLAKNCQFAHVLGASLVVLHLWGLPESRLAIAHALDTLPHSLDVATAHGVHLAVETIPSSVADPLTIIRQAVECDSRCLVALDTEFLAFHNQWEEALTATWLWQEDRVRHVHIKDYDGQLVGSDNVRRYLHPGEGKIDFASVFTTLHEQRFAGGISLEAPVIGPDGVVDVDRLQQSVALLQEWTRGTEPGSR